MAKSIRLKGLHEIEELGGTAAKGSGGGFGGNWFWLPSPIRSRGLNLTEHAVWEKAVHWELLATEKGKS